MVEEYVCSSLASRVSVQHGAVTVLEQNSATEGGGIYSDGSEIRTGVMSLHFLGNSASKTGGGLSVMRTHEGTSNMLSISANFTTNKAEVCGGAVHVAAEMNIEFRNVTVVFKSGSAICVSEDIKTNFLGRVDKHQFQYWKSRRRNKGALWEGTPVIQRQHNIW